MNDMYKLNENAYIAFSGGRDSTVLSVLVDLALPGNTIPRVFINTGVEYKAITDFVKTLTEKDKRFILYNSGVSIRTMLEAKGYPFKSKEFSQKLYTFQNSGKCKTVTDYLGETGNKDKAYTCPEKLKIMFTDEFTLKVSDKCCKELKKKVSEKWAKENKKSIAITGLIKGEGGVRSSHSSCAVFKEGNLKKFHPLFPVNDSFIDFMIKEQKIELCKLYYPPYNFKRTGCKGCPFNRYLKEQLEVMKELLPAEYKQCEMLWKPVYEVYRKLNYRLDNKID